MTRHECRFVSRSRAFRFVDPVHVVSATRLSQVAPALREIEVAVASGLHAAGFMAYEAAPAFDPALETHETDTLPLLWFGLYQSPEPLRPDVGIGAPDSAGPWVPQVSEAHYADAIRRIRDYIASGDTYQVNYTFPMRAAFSSDPAAWFEQLCRAQQADYCAFLDTGASQVLSASPELFFRLESGRIEMRPMKGTRRRGLYPAADREAARDLVSSEKERAENLMIVDLIRNDLGRIAQTGSVHVDSLFNVERYETVWQMTSTVSARTTASVPEIFAALFPSGSVTGAPKVRTMQIIRELEPFPRGVYCGSVGWWSPDGRAEFNVAIRTVTIDADGSAEYHVGGGITWDSTAEGEYDECQAKAAVLTHRQPDFELLESVLWDRAWFLLDEHLERLSASADYFGFRLDLPAIRDALQEEADELALADEKRKVRLLVARDGAFRIEAASAPVSRPIRVGFAREPVSSDDIFLYHKTTCRAVYERARQSRPDCDDVLLWNKRGEITESTTANVVINIDGRLVTPPIRCGLLGGCMRAHLLAEGAIEEGDIHMDDVLRADSIHLINSVRRWIDVELV